MAHLFRECSSLKSLPDISKWNVNKVIKFDNLFSYCSSLLTLPEISKWEIFENIVIDVEYDFDTTYKLNPNVMNYMNNFAKLHINKNYSNACLDKFPLIMGI